MQVALINSARADHARRLEVFDSTDFSNLTLAQTRDVIRKFTNDLPEHSELRFLRFMTSKKATDIIMNMIHSTQPLINT